MDKRESGYTADWAPLVDVSDVPVEALISGSEGTALDRSVRRLVDGLDDPNDVISAFQSFTS